MKNRFVPLICFAIIIFALPLWIFEYVIAQQEGVACPGSVPSRLIVGEQGRVTPGNANNIRSEPSTNGQRLGEIPGGTTFLILEGPRCAEGYAWWRVDFSGIIGWTVEGNAVEYWLEPAGPLPTQAATVTPTAAEPQTPLPAACPGFLPSRLIVGDQGRVVPGPANNLRAEPASGTQQLAEIPGGATFLVLEGPLCAQGLAWWRVDYRGLVGWTAEGLVDEYWLEPAGPVPTQTPTLTPTLTMTPGPTLTPSFTPSPMPVMPVMTTFIGRENLLFAPLPEDRAPIDVSNIDELRPLALVGGVVVEKFAASPDGEMVAVLNSLGVWLVKADGSDAPGVLLENPNLTITSMAFSPDGTLLALGSAGRNPDGVSRLQLWDVESGRQLPAFRAVIDEIHSLAFSPDGRYLATGGVGYSVQLFDVETGQGMHTVSPGQSGRLPVTQVLFSPDGSQLAFTDNLVSISIWNMTRNEHQIEYEIDAGRLGELTFSADNLLLYAAGDGGSSRTPGVLRIWDLTTSQQLTSPQFPEAFSRLALSPDGSLLALYGVGSSQVYLWDTALRELKATLPTEVGIRHVTFLPAGESLAAAHADGTVRTWNTASGENEVVLDYGAHRAYDQIALHPSGELIALAAQSDTVVRLYDAVSREEVQVFDDFNGSVTSLHFPDRTHLHIQVENARGTQQFSWDWAADFVQETTVSPTPFHRSEYVLLARDLIPRGHSATISTVRVPGTPVLAAADGLSLQFWNIDSRQPLAAMHFFGTLLDFSEDATTMITMTDGVLWLWGIPAG